MDMANQNSNMLTDLHLAGRYDELLALSKKRVELSRAKYGADDKRVGLVLRELSQTYYEMQDYSASEEPLRESMKIFGQFFGHASKQYTTCLSDLARLCIF